MNEFAVLNLYRLRHWFPGAGDPLDWLIEDWRIALESIPLIEREKREP